MWTILIFKSDFFFSLFRVIFNIQSILAVYPQVQKVKPFQHGGSHKIITINGRFVVLRFFFFFFNFVFFDGGRRPKIGVDGTKFNVESAVFFTIQIPPLWCYVNFCTDYFLSCLKSWPVRWSYCKFWNF